MTLRLRGVQRHRRDTACAFPADPARPRSGCRSAPARSTAATCSRAESIVRRLDQRVDVVVVLPHWGDQYNHAPSRRNAWSARRCSTPGPTSSSAGTRTGCRGSPSTTAVLIVNSLGNFVFDMDFSVPRPGKGVTVDLICWGDQIKAVRFTPYVIGPDFAPRPVRGPVAQTHPRPDVGDERSSVPALTERPTAARAESRARQPRPHQDADPPQLGWVDHRRQVGSAVIPGVRRPADRAAGIPASSNDSVVARRVHAGQRRDAGPDTGADQLTADDGRPRPGRADGDHGADADAVHRDHPGHGRALVGAAYAATMARDPKWCRASPSPRGSSPPKATRTTGRRVSSCADIRASSSSTLMPDASSSAPGACGTVSRWALTTRCGSVGSKPGRVATTLVVVPESTSMPQEFPAGTCTG